MKCDKPCGSILVKFENGNLFRVKDESIPLHYGTVFNENRMKTFHAIPTCVYVKMERVALLEIIRALK